MLKEFFDEGEENEQEVNSHVEKLTEAIEDLEFRNMLSSEEDSLDAILEINSGAGGTESQDWAEMLLRMYVMYCDKNQLNATITEKLDGVGAE